MRDALPAEKLTWNAEFGPHTKKLSFSKGFRKLPPTVKTKFSGIKSSVMRGSVITQPADFIINSACTSGISIDLLQGLEWCVAGLPP